MAEKILIVDDEDGIRKVLALSLSQTGYQVLTASQGAAAIQIVRDEHPAIVLADIKMPGMDGLHLLQKIKEESPETEVIMMTGHADLDAAVRSLQYEAADFITKPINWLILGYRVRYILRASRALEEVYRAEHRKGALLLLRLERAP